MVIPSYDGLDYTRKPPTKIVSRLTGHRLRRKTVGAKEDDTDVRDRQVSVVPLFRKHTHTDVFVDDLSYLLYLSYIRYLLQRG